MTVPLLFCIDRLYPLRLDNNARGCPSQRTRMQKEVAMDIQLTPQQQQALDNQEYRPLRVIDPRTNTAYVLVPEVDYRSCPGIA